MTRPKGTPPQANQQEPEESPRAAWKRLELVLSRMQFQTTLEGAQRILADMRTVRDAVGLL